MMNQEQPDYQRIYSDIIELCFPEKREDCKELLCKTELSVFDILLLNKKIFGNDKVSKQENSKYISYQKHDILFILDYQKKHKLNNTQVAIHFKMSRNTISKWKKIFLV